MTTILPQAAETAAPVPTVFGVDHLWVLTAATLVFFMQAGFMALEVGSVRRKSVDTVAFKNLVDFLVAAIGFYVLGFGLMFGHNLGGPVGTDLFAWNGKPEPGGSSLGMIFLLFQLAFASSAVTIVSGATAERIRFVTYLVAAAAIGAVVYPVFGHWAWGNLFFGDNTTWLVELGFVDFAGSTVVHSVGGWIALVAIAMLGPRRGRYDDSGRVLPVAGYSQAWSVLGVFVLWFGWWGFNGGSTLALNGEVGTILLNTNLAGAAAGLTAFAHAWYAQGRRHLKAKLLGGSLGGLVAITANCNMVSPMSALVIGALAGIVHNQVHDRMLHRWRLDDPVGAVPVHLACGILGTLCVGLFGDVARFPHGHSRIVQIGVQVVGVIACAAWSCACAYGLFKFLRHVVGLRLSPSEEAHGNCLDLDAVPAVAGDDKAARHGADLIIVDLHAAAAADEPTSARPAADAGCAPLGPDDRT